MGRFYRTARPQNIDYMYKLPEQYMLAAVRQASDDITANQAAMYDLYGKLQLNALAKDKPRAREILNQYESAINEISSELQNDPLEFRRKGGDLMRLSREMYKDFTRGEAAAIQSNYNADAEWQKAYTDLARQGKLEHANWLAALHAKNLGEYEGVGYDPTTGDYNTYSPEELVPFVDINKKVDEAVKGIEPYIQAWAEADFTDDGEFIVEWGGKRETVSAQRIKDIVTSSIYGDAQVMNFVNQGTDIGMLRGFQPEDIYIENEDGTSSLNPASPVANMINVAISKYAYDNQTAAHKRLKNIPDGSSSTRTNGNGDTVDLITKELTFNDTPWLKRQAEDTRTEKEKSRYARGKKGGVAPPAPVDPPSVQFHNRIYELENNDTHRQMLKDGFAESYRAIQVALRQGWDAEEAADILTQTQEAVNNLDFSKLNQVVDMLGIPDSGLNSSLYAIQGMKNEAENMKIQNEVFKQAVVKHNNLHPNNKITLDEYYLRPELHESNATVPETRGGWYLEEADRKAFNKAMGEVDEYFSGQENMGQEIVVSTTDKNGKTTQQMMNMTDILRIYFNKKGKAELTVDEEADAQQAMAQSIAESLAAKYNKSNDRELSEVGTFRIMSEVPYVDGNDAKSYTNPFGVKLTTEKGDVISLIIPASAINSTELGRIDNDNQYRYDLEGKLRKINLQLAGVNKFATDSGFNLELPEGKEYSILERDGMKVTYIPPLGTSGSGLLHIYDKEGNVSKPFSPDDPNFLTNYRMIFGGYFNTKETD